MFDIGVQELMVILLIALFFFGGEKLPEIAKGLGKGIREFKRTMHEMDEDERERRMKVVSKNSSTNSQARHSEP
jgi:sec-independent protein translocase protein TatA